MTSSFTKYIKEFYWTVPFLCFILGYQSFSYFFYRSVIETPPLVGKTLPEVAIILSQHNLNMRMISLQEDPDLPAGTIISQTPRAHNPIKPQQTIFFVLSKKPAQPKISDMRGQTIDTISKTLRNSKIRYRICEVNSPQPAGTCVAQIPEPGKEIASSGALLYIASEEADTLLFPSCKGKTVQEVKQFLERYNIPVEIYNTHSTEPQHADNASIVFEQKPLAGSFVSLKEPFTVQLKV